MESTSANNTRVATVVIEDDDNLDSILSYYQPSVEVDNINTFADELDFAKIHNIVALPWKSLEIGKIFHIRYLKKITTRNSGQAIILHLYEKDSEEVHIHWSPSILTKELMCMKEFKNLYVKSTGMKRSFTGRDYYSFQLIQKM